MGVPFDFAQRMGAAPERRRAVGEKTGSGSWEDRRDRGTGEATLSRLLRAERLAITRISREPDIFQAWPDSRSGNSRNSRTFQAYPDNSEGDSRNSRTSSSHARTIGGCDSNHGRALRVGQRDGACLNGRRIAENDHGKKAFRPCRSKIPTAQYDCKLFGMEGCEWHSA